jgi:hypothetical protein
MSVFIEGKKRRGKRGHRDDRTLRVWNPSIIAPTNVRIRDITRVEDYRKKSFTLIQEIRTISKQIRSSENKGYTA